ncbi:hypothetical protein DFQ28_009263 [Apophysomyces sp. BC1034]|nr:hypothetical protein DFQ30_009006 [Apophysomyces sp. BC1015]KAG0173359.1 hypothetical protein DFQ29_007978 [Apophysomyces sp. BC1021]KAG0185481.1 hypothetical protein DFQ28_009263 [Apophysomyces sp. BC1034]
MLDPFVWLLLLSLTLLVGAFLFGSIPLATKLSESKLHYLTALGIGLLIGTALVVIVPEGVETLYSSIEHTSPLTTRGGSTTSAPAAVAATGGPSWVSLDDEPVQQQDDAVTMDPGQMGEGVALHTAVGMALIVGFAVMFVIDQVSSMHVHAASPPATVEYNELEPLEEGEEEAEGRLGGHTPPSPSQRSITPTVGLIVHAAADGIALGASASHPQLSMVVFLAIMLHKAPSAFALTTVLLASGVSRVRVRKHLMLFSMAAPLGAVLTYLILACTSTASSSNLEYWTGVLLIFSGGTFLYVAMHALQEVQPNKGKKLDATEVGTILLGMFLPVLLNVKHSH